MSRQYPSPPSSFPQPYAKRRSSNPAQNESSDSTRPQDGLPPRHAYPPTHNARISPSQVYSFPQPPPPSSRRSTHPTAPTNDHASAFSRQPAPPLSGSISHHQPFPARYTSISSSSPPPPMSQRAATIPMPVHPNIAPPMPVPYGMSSHPSSRSEISGRSQSSSQSWSYLDVNEREDDFSGEDYEQGPEGMWLDRSPPNLPFASRKQHRKRPGKGSQSRLPVPEQRPCQLCTKLSPRHVIEQWGGFCCEAHRTQWIAVNQQRQ